MQDDKAAGPPYRAYVLCTSPRSGSTLLCRLLAASGIAGQPESYFHAPSVESWAAELSRPPAPGGDALAFLRAVVDAAIAEGTAGTGLFGLRLQRHSFDFFLAQLARLHPAPRRDRDRFEAAFGRTLFIHLTRADKLAQAVSIVKAEQSGLWHVRPDGSELERLKPHQDPVYDGAAIRRHRDEMLAMDRQWGDWFAQQGIEPLSLTYDELAADPRATLARVLRALGLDARVAGGVAVGVKRLSDETSRAWVERFQAEQQGR